MAKPKIELPWNSMTWDELAGKIENEGFDYFFCDYTSGPFNDAMLTGLARSYREASKALKEYVYKKADAPQ